MADPNQQAAEKLDREIKKVQAEQAANAEKTYENIKAGKTMPTENDMGPLPKKPTKKFSKGGSASARADGIATKGKTRGKIC